MEATTYFEVIPEEIITSVILQYLDNKSIYNLYLSLKKVYGQILDKFLNMMVIKDPIKYKDGIWEIISDLLSNTNGIIAGSYILKNILDEDWSTDVDIYISEDYLGVIKSYIQRMNDYFDETAGKRVPGARCGGVRQRPIGRSSTVVDGTIIEKDPNIYFKLQGFDADVPSYIYEITYRTSSPYFLLKIEIVVIKSKYDVLSYLRKITDFRFLRNYLIYNLGRRRLVVDYPDEVFDKIMELNHDRHIKIDRFIKYEERGFKYFKGEHDIDIFRSLDLLRGFSYPYLVGYFDNDEVPVLYGAYTDVYKIKECIGVSCPNCMASESRFKQYFHSHRHYISKEEILSEVRHIQGIISITYPDITIVKLKYVPDEPTDDSCGSSGEW